jgi:hypothetical protein
VLAGAALLTLPSQPRRAQIAAGLVALVGLLTLSQYLCGWNQGIDQWLVRDAQTAPDAFPGRMSPASALNFTLAGAALLLLARTRLYSGAQALALSLLHCWRGWLLYGVSRCADHRFVAGAARPFCLWCCPLEFCAPTLAAAS